VLILLPLPRLSVILETLTGFHLPVNWLSLLVLLLLIRVLVENEDIRNLIVEEDNLTPFSTILLSVIIGTDRKGRPKNPVALVYYKRKLTEGKTKKETLTCLMRRLCDIIFCLMKDRSEYVMLEISY